MTMAVKKQLPTSIKLAILAILAALGIFYILEKPPVDGVNNYQKQSMPKPFIQSRGSDYSSRKSTDSDSDAVSLTGKSGSYDEARIGNEYKQ